MTAGLTELVIGPVSSVPLGEGRTFSAFGEKIAIFRTRTGQVFAVQAACPHRAGPLADGLVGGTTLICPLHAWKFDLSSGAVLNGDCGLRTYPVRVDETGRIILSIEVDRM